MKFDFHTADNAPRPHVSVFRENEPVAVFATVPIEHGNTEEAERIAEIIVRTRPTCQCSLPAPKPARTVSATSNSRTPRPRKWWPDSCARKD